jgi:hypothetical protein
MTTPVARAAEAKQDNRLETKESEYSEPAYSDKLGGYPTFFHKHEATEKSENKIGTHGTSLVVSGGSYEENPKFYLKNITVKNYVHKKGDGQFDQPLNPYDVMVHRNTLRQSGKLTIQLNSQELAIEEESSNRYERASALAMKDVSNGKHEAEPVPLLKL